jgi:transcriptional regulator with XRE-family HTH domain
VGSTPIGPTLHKRRLARKLKQMREEARMTLQQAAPRLDKTKSALSRVEKGETAADVHLIRTMMDLYNKQMPELLELAREAATPGWWTAYGIRDRGYIGLETDAIVAKEFSLVYVPGLLQTEEYMSLVFNSVRVKPSPSQVANQVAAREYRQRRLADSESPLRLHAIIDETVLRKPIGTPELRKAQWRHLVEAVELDTVTLQVVPDERGIHAGMDGSFNMLEFEDDEDPDLLFVAHVAGALHMEKPGELAEAKLAFDSLRSTALSPEESVAFIDELARR